MSRTTPGGTASVRLRCRTFELSRQAYSAARRAPAPTVRRLPTRPTAASTATVRAAIRGIVAAEPAWGVRKVWATLRRRASCVSRKRVWALMHAAGLVRRRDREPGDPPRGQVAVPEPTRRWATDLPTAWTTRDGWVAVVPTIDGGCRSLLALDVTKAQDARAVRGSVNALLTEHFGPPAGVPDGLELRSDHGPQSTGQDCADLVRGWGLAHTFAPVGRPMGNAVVARPLQHDASAPGARLADTRRVPRRDAGPAHAGRVTDDASVAMLVTRPDFPSARCLARRGTLQHESDLRARGALAAWDRPTTARLARRFPGRLAGHGPAAQPQLAEALVHP